MREPSAPNITRPSPTSAKCTPTETISSTSVLASASGWYASRYSIGPSGITISSVRAICASIGRGCPPYSCTTKWTASGNTTYLPASTASRRGAVRRSSALRSTDTHS